MSVYEKFKVKLAEDVEEQEIRLVKERLIEEDERFLYVSLKEIETAWEIFSDDHLARYFYISEKTIEQFIEWLK